MFGKRTTFGGNTPGVGQPARPVASPPPRAVETPAAAAQRRDDAVRRQVTTDEVLDVRAPADAQRDKEYFQTKSAIFNALIDSIDLSQLATMDQQAAREEIRDIVAEIIALKSIVMSISEQEDLLEDICNDVLGYGPLEPLLARDDIADIMVNGSQRCYIEVAG